jgi:Tfp pilus assembly protein FimT
MIFKMVQIPQSGRDRVENRRFDNARGYTMVELLLVVVIAMILTAIAIPQVKSGMNRYRLQGAIASSTWAIQSTRYQALQLGYPFQVVLTTSNNSYQIQSSPSNNGTYTNVGTSVPLSGSATTLSANTTLQFRPNGFVSATVGALNFTISYQGLCQKATVTNYANITLGKIGQTCP